MRGRVFEKKRPFLLKISLRSAVKGDAPFAHELMTWRKYRMVSRGERGRG